MTLFPQQRGAAEPPEQEFGTAEEVEEVDALPVLADGPELLRVQRLAREPVPERSRARQLAAARPAIPAVQAAAVAAGSFVAGAAVAGLVHRRQRVAPGLARGGRIGKALARGGSRKGARSPEPLQIVSSRTLLVDVHMLGTPRPDR